MTITIYRFTADTVNEPDLARGIAVIDEEQYLHDGIYASFDGYHVKLRAPRAGGDHWVALEPETMIAFTRYLEHLMEKYPGLQARWQP